MDPIVASYTVEVTVRSADAGDGLQIDEIQEAVEEAVEQAMAEHNVHDSTVNATAKRTDR